MSSGQLKLCVLTGANGSGKTTFFETLLAPRGVLFVNADILARQINPDTLRKRASPPVLKWFAIN